MKNSFDSLVERGMAVEWAAGLNVVRAHWWRAAWLAANGSNAQANHHAGWARDAAETLLVNIRAPLDMLLAIEALLELPKLDGLIHPAPSICSEVLANALRGRGLSIDGYIDLRIESSEAGLK